MTQAESTTSDAGIDLLCWNIWLAGQMVDDGLTKITRVVTELDADLVCLQESGDVPGALSANLGMQLAQQGIDTSVLSTDPLVQLETATAPFATAALATTPLGQLIVWSAHLNHTDYGPYRAAELPEAQASVMAQPGEVLRLEQARQILSETQRLLDELGDLPVIVAGDFNVPSSQDWNGTFRPAVTWPATQIFLDQGYVDAFRTVHPDVCAATGLTWSQIEQLDAEPRDRIDFVFVRGLHPLSATHHGGAADDADHLHDAGFVGFPGLHRHVPNQRANPFPSDHLAIRVRLTRQGGRQQV